MSVFVDTSALYAVLDQDDADHRKANETWQRLILQDEALVCTNYVLVETSALLQSRLGLEAVRVFEEDVAPVLSVQWVDSATHRSGVAALLAASRRRMSLVDCVSFEVMRRLGIKAAFAFDRHFREHGFERLQ